MPNIFASVITGVLSLIERRRLGHEDVLFLGTRRNKDFDGQCDRSSSKDNYNDIEDAD